MQEEDRHRSHSNARLYYISNLRILRFFLSVGFYGKFSAEIDDDDGVHFYTHNMDDKDVYL